ncbi:hypothetical protein BC937DRAFT_92412 [Endogone sp. FLAS-F59071]|nr:hypothetical protein BC937DRAFT_92412 [Endogone sp. FLAS-F59071]|eukprot:RUS15466.1 hypothetical protein BC937DRAFT_92412 [Endogone sp. FLAS-F59071]
MTFFNRILRSAGESSKDIPALKRNDSLDLSINDDNDETTPQPPLKKARGPYKKRTQKPTSLEETMDELLSKNEVSCQWAQDCLHKLKVEEDKVHQVVDSHGDVTINDPGSISATIMSTLRDMNRAKDEHRKKVLALKEWECSIREKELKMREKELKLKQRIYELRKRKYQMLEKKYEAKGKEKSNSNGDSNSDGVNDDDTTTTISSDSEESL